MLISAMDNIRDNKCANNADSNESNSLSNVSESDERDNENDFDSDAAGDEHEIDQRSTNSSQKCFPGTDILQEIDMTEIKFLKAIGKGSFGVVHKAIWKGRTVAVKKVETDTEVSAFQNEIKQLSRVRHDNIIQMYGTGTSLHAKCIIMEFANDGSLYQFLHCPPHQKYNLAHALSWLLQCARAIAYLHSIEPRKIIHRDLKPLNMLLTNGKKVLKVCDFGTACDLRSVMTDNKGSTAWMAPEVIKGSSYNEKCDVYSWGMILWELLTRRVPFEELGQAYRIIWQVVNNARPPLIQGCPKPIERLMKRCWLDEQSERPSMQEVVDIVYPLYKVVNDGEEGIGSFSSSGESSTESCASPLNGESSAGHTSRDVSEIASSSTNTNDLPENAKNEAYTRSTFFGHESSSKRDGHDEYSKFPPTLQERISPNASASFVVGVENLLPPWGSAKSDDVYTSPYCSITPLSVTPKKPTSWNGGKLKHPPPPEMQIPLSITIPNDGASNIPEANFILEPVTVDPSYSPWTFLTPSSHSSQSVSSTSSPTVSYLPRTVINAPEPFNPSPSHQLTSPTLPPVSTTVTLTPGVTNAVSSPVEKTSSSTLQVPLRRAKMSNDASASLRRRSAGDPQHNRASILPSRGHRRASSYESSELIGFEPLADEVLREQQELERQLCGGGLSPRFSESGPQWKKEKPIPPNEFWQQGASRISEEADCSLKDETDERAHEPLHFAGGPLYPARASHPPSTGANLGKGGISPVGPPQNQNTTSKLVSPTSPYTRGSYKGAGGFTPAGAAPPPSQGGKGSGAGAVTTESDELGSYWQLLDDDLKPTMPQPSCPHSQQIFDEHNELAHQLLVVQEEIVYLDKKKSQMLKKLEEQERDQQSCRQRYSDKISQLKSKNESLRHDHSRLSHQLEEIRARRQKGHHHQQQQNPQNKSSQQNLNNQRLYHHHHQLSSSSHISPSSAPSSQFPHVHIPNQLIPSHPSHQSPLSQQDHSPQHLQHLPQRQQQPPPQQSQHYYYDNHPLYPHHNQNQ